MKIVPTISDGKNTGGTPGLDFWWRRFNSVLFLEIGDELHFDRTSMGGDHPPTGVEFLDVHGGIADHLLL